MKIATMTFRLYAPWVHSLKEKRICRTFGLSRDIDGIDGQDIRPGSLIAFCG